MPVKKTPPAAKKTATAKKAGKPAAPPAKKGSPKAATPKALKTAPTKWRVVSSPAAAPEPPKDIPREPGRALMVIPQPEPLSPWDQFKADLPRSFEEFIAAIAAGNHMAAFCKERGINYTTLLKFITADPARSEMYAIAREDRADAFADETVAIADEAEVVATYKNGEVVLALDSTAVMRNKLRVDARKWFASKLKPRTYGDKVELGGTVNHKQLTDEQLLAALAGLGVAIPAIIPKGEGPSDEA